MRLFGAVLFGFFLSFQTATEAKSQKIIVTVGTTEYVARFAWVEVMNTEPIASGNGKTLSLLDRCSIRVGGMVNVVAVDYTRNIDWAAPGAVLLRYTPPYNNSDLNPCPEGTLYLTSTYRFSQMKQEWAAQAPQRILEENRRRKERDYMKKLLKKQ